MPRTSRARQLWLLAAACLATAVPAVSASAAAPAGIEHQSWAQTGPLMPPAANDDLLYVSQVGVQEQTRSFVSFAAAALAGRELASSTLVLKEDPSTVGAAIASLAACPLLQPLMQDGRIAQPPAADCKAAVPLKRETDGTWTLALRQLAPRITSGTGHGVAIVPAQDAASPAPYSVAFDPAGSTLTSTPAQPALGSGSGTTGSGSSGSASAGSASGAADARGSGPGVTGSLDTLEPTSADPAGALGSPSLPDIAEPAVDAAPPTSAVSLERTAAPAAPSRPSSRNSVPLVLAVVLGAAALWLVVNRLAGGPSMLPADGAAGAVTRKLPWLLPLALVAFLNESSTYKVGLIGIVFIAAVGLHILVNTAGELSLAHAALLGIPAFVVAQAAARTPLNSLTALPVGVLAGTAIGFLVGLTAQRARGLQVALVTLAVAIATVQFLYYQEWLVGPPGGFEVTAPSLFGWELASQSARAPVLGAMVVLAAAACTGILRSKLGRALAMVRSDADVAATVGIPSARYRGLAYMIAGAFAGLAGGCYAFWVQIVTPQAFPLQLGFTYLLIAALAGRGGVAGVAVSTVVVEAGVLFDFLPRAFTLYVAPVALILQVTRYEGGINALLRQAGARLRPAAPPIQSPDPALPKQRSTPMPVPTFRTAGGPPTVRLGFALGCLLALAGLVSITVAWYNTGRTNQVWIQLQEIASGGLIGISLVVLGSALIVRDALLYGRALVGATGIPAPLAISTPADGTALLPIEISQHGSYAVSAGATPEPAAAAIPTSRPPRRAPAGAGTR